MASGARKHASRRDHRFTEPAHPPSSCGVCATQEQSPPTQRADAAEEEKMAVWKDATSYSRGDKDRNPTAWEATSGEIRIWVGCAHRYYPGEWIMHCPALGMTEVRLGLADDTPVSHAQTTALTKVGDRLSKLAADYHGFE